MLEGLIEMQSSTVDTKSLLIDSEHLFNLLRYINKFKWSVFEGDFTEDTCGNAFLLFVLVIHDTIYEFPRLLHTNPSIVVGFVSLGVIRYIGVSFQHVLYQIFMCFQAVHYYFIRIRQVICLVVTIVVDFGQVIPLCPV